MKQSKNIELAFSIFLIILILTMSAVLLYVWTNPSNLQSKEIKVHLQTVEFHMKKNILGGSSSQVYLKFINSHNKTYTVQVDEEYYQFYKEKIGEEFILKITDDGRITDIIYKKEVTQT